MKHIENIAPDMPFYTQIADIKAEGLQGFRSMDEALYWSENGCGIASVRMVIDGFMKRIGKDLSGSYGEMVYSGLDSGAYCEKGWIHAGLIRLAGDYGVSGEAHRQTTVHDIKDHLRMGRPVIASVSPLFKGGTIDESGKAIPRGGHLIVVKGLVTKGDDISGFLVNYPSSTLENNSESLIVGIDEFENSFSGSFMSFWVE